MNTEIKNNYSYTRPSLVPNYKIIESGSSNIPKLEVSEVETLSINQLNQKVIPPKLKEQWNKKEISPEYLVSSLLNHNKLVFIGEVPHANHDAIDFTSNNLKSFIKENNLGTIYIELLNESKQVLIDNYLNEKDQVKAEKALSLIYSELEKSGSSGWNHKVEIIKEAKRLKAANEDVRIVTFNQAKGELY